MSKSIREKYNIPQEAKVLLYVGNISENKNQLQMVRVFGMLTEELRSNTYVLFCGEDHAKDGIIENEISKVPDSDHLILCGGVDRTMMPDYYSEADGVVLLSFAEGFGLSLIEGMHFGLPCVMPIDLDAFEDIYDECAVVGIENRDDQTVATAMRTLLDKEWDRDRIRSYSNKFAPAAMANGYLDVYEKVVI